MRTIKLVIIGDSGVGKTSIRGQYISGRFSTGYRATIGTDFITKTLPHHSKPDESVTLQIWDTAGQERFSSLSSAFFRGADAALLMYDVNHPETLEGLRKWWNEFRERAPVLDEDAEDYCCVVVGNKVDLIEHTEDGESVQPGSKSAVSRSEALKFLDELVPPSSWQSSPVEEYEDPFYDGNGTANVNGAPAELSVSQAYDLPVPDSPPRTRSIHIHRTSSSHSFPSLHPKHPNHISRSRSTDRSQLGGTMTTTRTNMTLYHTPSSSLFDAYVSAPSSPPLPSPLRSATLDRETSTSPSTPSTRHARRMTSASSSSSAPTITPSLFTRGLASASTTPPTPPRATPSLPPAPAPPERRPRLFLTSAKTGYGVGHVFEYIARRVVSRWEYEEEVEAHTLHVRDATGDTIRLGGADGRRTNAVAKWASQVSCCGS